MIGRLEILLPYDLFIPAGAKLEPVTSVRSGYPVKVFPLYQSQVDRSILSLDADVPMVSVFDGFDPRAVVIPSPSVSYDGQPTSPADVLRVDVRLLHDLERTSSAANAISDVARAEANAVLARLRVLGRAPHVRPITARTTSRFRFLHDDETEFTPAWPLVSQSRSYGHATDVLVVSQQLWGEARDLPDEYQPSAWDVLVLDATALLPDIGPAMVLAYAALEARITSALDQLASAREIDPALWEWLNERDHYSKQPSIRDRFDVLARWLGGRSLKQDPELWEGFARLRSARNSFAHTGVVAIGKNKEPVTHEDSIDLIAIAERIIDWVDEALPEALRRACLVHRAGLLEIRKTTMDSRTATMQIRGLSINASTPPLKKSGELPG